MFPYLQLQVLQLRIHLCIQGTRMAGVIAPRFSKQPLGDAERVTTGMGLVGEKSYPNADEDGGEPAAAIYLLVQEEFCGEGVSDEGEGGAGGGGE